MACHEVGPGHGVGLDGVAVGGLRRVERQHVQLAIARISMAERQSAALHSVALQHVPLHRKRFSRASKTLCEWRPCVQAVRARVCVCVLQPSNLPTKAQAWRQGEGGHGVP